MKRTLVTLLSAAAFAALPLVAQDAPSPEELQQKIRELEAKVEQLEQRSAAPSLDEIKREIDVLSREVEALSLAQNKSVVTADQSQHGMGAAASKVYRSEPGLSVGGYGEMLYENFDGSTDAGDPSGATDRLDMLRAIVYTGYKFNDRVLFNSEVEIEHATTDDGIGEVSLEFGYLDYLIRPELNVRAGVVLMPVGLINELHEPTAFLGARRPQVEQRIIPSTWSEAGAGIFGEKGPISYRAYVTTGLNAEEFSSSGIRSGRQKGAEAKAEDFAFVGRLDWQPVEGLLFGGSFYSGDSAQGETTSTGESFGGTVDLFEIHSDVRYRGLQFRALWADGSIGDAAAINDALGLSGAASVGSDFGGWYAEAGYDLTSIRPIGEMSLIPYVRYETYDTQKNVPPGFLRNPARDVDITTFGFAWKPIPQTIFKIDWQNVKNGAGTGVDQFNAAMGYVF